MRILMLDNEFPPLGGGTGVVNYHILKELDRCKDVWVDLVTSSRTRKEYEICHFGERINIYKVPVDNKNIHHATNRELLLYTWRGYRYSLGLMAENQYDFSYAFAGVPAGFISYILFKTKKLPYFISLQGPDVPGFEARYNYLYPFLKPVLRIIWRNAARVIAISEEHQQLALKTMPDLNIPIVFNGVEIDDFYPSGDLKTSGAVNILCVGRLIERKGQHHLLEAFALLKKSIQQPLHLTLAGTGDFEPELHRLVSNLGIADSVTFRGFVPRDSMPAVYRDADIFVLPSQSEGMSIALLEAMASGLPVVVTNAGGVKELIKPMENGLVISWADIESLQAALQQLIENPTLRDQFGKNNVRRAKELGWDQITQQYLELFHAIQ